METIVPSGLLALLDESVESQQIEGHQRVQSDEDLPSCDLNHILRSDLQHSSSCESRRSVSMDFVVERLGGPPAKSVMFDIESGSNTRVSWSRN